MFSVHIKVSAFLLRFEFEIDAISLSALITVDLTLGDFESSLLGSNVSAHKVSNCFFPHLQELYLHFLDIGLSYKEGKKTVETFLSCLSF